MIVTMSLTMSPTTAMSRILQCPELCRLVCEEIGSDDKCTLFRLSLSCRRFMEPALDVLWYKLDSFVPLVLCMAKDLRGEDVRPQEGKSLSFQRSMLGSDWEIFEAAAMRVRILAHSDFDKWHHGDVTYVLDSSIFPSLASTAQGRLALMPRLQQLTWKISNDDIFPYLSLFLSPTIADLTVYITAGSITSSRARVSLFASLASQCPNIRSLKLRALTSVTHSWRDLFSGCSLTAYELFSLWAGLGSLTLYGMDLSTLTDDLARLPALTTLALNYCRAIDSASPSTLKGFPMLRYLDVYSSNIDCCLHVLKQMSCTPLVRLHLHIAGTSCESQWVELFSILPNGISRDSLATVWFSTPINVPLRFQTISPLLQFRSMSHLTCAQASVGLDAGVDLDDNDVACIAKAWPCLKFISICPPGSVPSRLTLRALIPFAEYCPQLEDLSMKMNATAVELNEYEEKPGKGLHGGRLWRLHVFDSPIDNPACVAAFISAKCDEDIWRIRA